MIEPLPDPLFFGRIAKIKFVIEEQILDLEKYISKEDFQAKKKLRAVT